MRHLNWILVLLMTIIAPDVMASTVFINEIHYDNVNADTGEGVELAGTAGVDLTGWSVVLYNGGSGAAYGTLELTGTLEDQADGYGFTLATFSSVRMQNGSPDGIALIDDTNTVVQFLSYEGSFTAIDGFASGTTSSDIGVKESGKTPLGYSLQLTGSGRFYEDFTWENPAVNTFGTINNDQSFSPIPIPGALWLLCSGIVGLVGFTNSKKNR